MYFCLMFYSHMLYDGAVLHLTTQIIYFICVTLRYAVQAVWNQTFGKNDINIIYIGENRRTKLLGVSEM